MFMQDGSSPRKLSKRQPTVSVCLVVKNEELFLRECLASVSGFADEVIVVDTGSGDRTVAIATASGARVFEEPWPGDLGRAHDLPLEHAESDWVLTLDGDEAIDPADGPALRGLIDDTTADGFVFTVRNYGFHPGTRHHACDGRHPLVKGARTWQPSTAVRLFRNRPEFRHEGRVHQSVQMAMLRHGATIQATDVPIHHWGFLRGDRWKQPLYVELALQQVIDQPDDAKSWIELGIIQMLGRNFEAALRSFERAVELGARGEAHAQIAAVHVQRQDYDAAISAYRAAIDEVPDQPWFLDLADLWEALGFAHERAGNAAAAEAALRQVLALRPDSPVARAALVGLLSAGGAVDEAAAVCDPLIIGYPGLHFTWDAVGCIAMARREYVLAVQHFERAIEIAPEQWSSLYNLTLALFRAGRLRAARKIYRQAVAADRLGELGPIGDTDDPPPALPGVTSGVEAPRLGPNGVLHFIPHLSGGGAFVAAELCRALVDTHPQMIAALDLGESTGEAHHCSFEALDIPVISLRDRDALADLLRTVRPAVVIHHWWLNSIVTRIERVENERLVIVNASPLPMPPGYDRYVTLSAFQEQYQGHLDPARTDRIPNGVDLAHYRKDAPLGRFPMPARRGGEVVRIGMLSRLDPDKFARRLGPVLAPLAGCPVTVEIAGRGGRRYEIEPELVEYGLQHQVRFLGPIPQAEVASFLASCDIGLHLTETHQESHSISILQMMASSLPVVAQPRGCLPEMIRDGETGFLSFAESALSQALVRLVEDGALRARMGAQARAAMAAFSSNAFASRWRALVDRVLAEMARA
jgi:glycosyltransferase involved in cell wall biosynthesis